MYRCLGICLTFLTMSELCAGWGAEDYYYYDDEIVPVEYIVHFTSDDMTELLSLMSPSGLTYQSEVFTHYHLFTGAVTEGYDIQSLEDSGDPNLQWVNGYAEHQRSLRTITFTANDAMYILQGNLRATSPSSPPAMNVIRAWERGYSGQGVVVAVVDNGIDETHIDLVDNYDESISFNYVDYNGSVAHESGDNSHGTLSAGVIGAVKNEHCVIGVAYQSTIAAVKFITGTQTLVSTEAMALTHRLDIVDIYSCGWGPQDNGKTIDFEDALDAVQRGALKKGITEGRNGKGVIYVWAVGNGYKKKDDCNLDGYVNSIYTIGITTIQSNGNRDPDAETCAAVMATTYGSSSPTLTKDDACEISYSGTSAAAATASGIIALMLEANGELTWRDVQYIIVDNSVTTDLDPSSFITNGAGKQVSQNYGFGVMDADAMVNASLYWTLVQPLIEWYGEIEVTSSIFAGVGGLFNTYEVTDCPVTSIEQVIIYINCDLLWREYSEIYIVSPLNTISRLFKERKLDDQFGQVLWYFSSLAFWGENPNGQWTITMNSTSTNNQIYLNAWSLSFSGTNVTGAVLNPSGPLAVKSIEIEENDMPLIVGASLGAAVGFVLLVISCTFVVKVFVRQMAKDALETVETIQDNNPYDAQYKYDY